MRAVLFVLMLSCEALYINARHFQYYYINQFAPILEFNVPLIPNIHIPSEHPHRDFPQSREFLQPGIPMDGSTNNYRGYTYHTTYDDGASSTVVFFKGPPVANILPNTTFSERHTVTSDGIGSTKGSNLNNIAGALNDENGQYKTDTPSLKDPLSLITVMLKLPVEMNGIVHFFDNVPANTYKLQGPSKYIQESESVISESFLANVLGYKDTMHSGQRNSKALYHKIELNGEDKEITESINTTVENDLTPNNSTTEDDVTIVEASEMSGMSNVTIENNTAKITNMEFGGTTETSFMFNSSSTTTVAESTDVLSTTNNEPMIQKDHGSHTSTMESTADSSTTTEQVSKMDTNGMSTMYNMDGVNNNTKMEV